MERLENKRRMIQNIGKAIAYMECFAFTLGIATFAILNNARNSKLYVPLIGEQIWGPFVIIMTSRAIDLPTSGCFTFRKVRNCLVISMFCAIVSFSLFIIEGFFTVVYYGHNYIAYKLLTGGACLTAFSSLLLSIISTTYCCFLLPECGCCSGNQSTELMYFNASNRFNGIPQIVPPLLERSVGDPPPPYPGRPLSIPSIPPPQYHE